MDTLKRKFTKDANGYTQEKIHKGNKWIHSRENSQRMQMDTLKRKFTKDANGYTQEKIHKGCKWIHSRENSQRMQMDTLKRKFTKDTNGYTQEKIHKGCKWIHSRENFWPSPENRTHGWQMNMDSSLHMRTLEEIIENINIISSTSYFQSMMAHAHMFMPRYGTIYKLAGLCD